MVLPPYHILNQHLSARFSLLLNLLLNVDLSFYETDLMLTVLNNLVNFTLNNIETEYTTHYCSVGISHDAAVLICHFLFMYPVFHPHSRPFRPSLTSCVRSSTLRPVQELSLPGDSLLSDITLVGGNDSGIFVSSVCPGSSAEKAGLIVGHHLLMVIQCIIYTMTAIFVFDFIFTEIKKPLFSFCPAKRLHPGGDTECAPGYQHSGRGSLDTAEMHWAGSATLQM